MALEILSVVHANVNCSELERSLRFYRDGLGLRPTTHTNPLPQEGEGFGLPGKIQWDAHILHDERGAAGTAVDLLEWKIPTPVGRPYAEPHHVGLARFGFRVPDVDALHAWLVESGVDCLAAPAKGPVDPREATQPRFFCARDPDGTLLELVEEPGAAFGPRHLAVGCRDLARSLEWYERVLGLACEGRKGSGPEPGTPWGLRGEVEWEAALLVVPGQPEGFAIELVEWRRPRGIGVPYPTANHLGIFRTAFLVADAHASYEELRRHGVECPPPAWLDMGPEVPIDGLWALFFPDPDGSCLELIQRW